MAKLDGMGPVACQGVGIPRGCLQPGWARDPCPLQIPDPCKVRKEIQGQFSTETPGWTRTL